MLAAEQSSLEKRLRVRPVAMAAAALTLATVAAWLVDVTRGLPDGLCRAVALVWLAALALLAAVWLRPRLGGGGWRGEPAIVGALLALSLLVRFTGLDWEVGAGYYRDEGIYREAASLINRGQLLPDSFIYGHVPYYLAAFAAWLGGLFPGAMAALVRLVYGVGGDAQVGWIVHRSAGALCGALTTLPVYAVAWRLGGRAAGVVAGLLIIFSQLYNEVAHVFISDVPAAFFATLCLACAARLVDEERRRDYLLAGVCAGLAAASKYPAGVVAVGIVAVWLRWRWRRRDLGGGLVWAGLAALVTFVATMPALLVHTAAAFAGRGKDLFFGFRQYAQHGWIGVQPESNLRWYGDLLLGSFGAPALLLGVAGLLLLRRAARARLLALLPFPALYLGLLLSMSMVVKRNLQPVLPALAAFLGVGAAAWLVPLERTRLPARAAAALVGLLVVAPPAYRTLEEAWSLGRPSTRELAVAWIREHLPRGTALVKESYTPQLDRGEYTWLQSRFAGRLSLEEIQDPANDYLLLAENAYARFLDEANLKQPHHFEIARRYRELFRFEQVATFAPGFGRRGPELTLYRLHPVTVRHRCAREFAAGDAGFTSPAQMRAAGGLRWPTGGGWALFKDYFRAGDYEAVLIGARGEEGGKLVVVTRDGEPVGEAPWVDGRARLRLPAADKYFFYVHLPPGATLARWSLAAAGCAE